MDKTPGQVAQDAYHRIDGHKTDEAWERASAAVIAHARQKIEAEARAAAVEEVIADVQTRGVFQATAIRAIASAPPGYVCVPASSLLLMQHGAHCHSKYGANEKCDCGLDELLAARQK